MRSTIGWLAAGALIAGMGCARADVYSDVMPISGGWSDGGGQTNISPNYFNPSLGTLTGLTFGIQGTGGITFYSADTPGPIDLNYQIGAGIIEDGFTPQTNGYNKNVGAGSGFGDQAEVDTNFTLATTFTVPTDALGIYAVPSYPDVISGWLNIGPAGWSGPAFDGYSGQFGGTLTETFTYTPTVGDPPADPVPEPGSFALLGTAAFMLAGATGLTKRRRRNGKVRLAGKRHEGFFTRQAETI